MTAEPRWDAALVHPEDDVATALRTLPAGTVARIQDGAQTRECRVAEEIPFGHKLAVRDLAAGQPVRKYGEVIGEMTVPVARGACVHVHNLVSRRARAGSPRWLGSADSGPKERDRRRAALGPPPA